jgi:hypothetical protein
MAASLVSEVSNEPRRDIPPLRARPPVTDFLKKVLRGVESVLLISVS